MKKIIFILIAVALSFVPFEQTTAGQSGKNKWTKPKLEVREAKKVFKGIERLKASKTIGEAAKAVLPNPPPVPHYQYTGNSQTGAENPGRRHGESACLSLIESPIVTVGTSNVCAILAKEVSEPIPMTSAAVCDRLREFAQEVREVSYGNLELNITCTDWLEVPLSDDLSSFYDVNTILAAADPEVDFSQCNQLILILPPIENYFGSGTGWLPYGTNQVRSIDSVVPEQPNVVGISIYNTMALSPPPGLDYGDWDYAYVTEFARHALRHEFHHGLGLINHANGFECGHTIEGPAPPCDSVEAEDRGDPMGTGVWFPHTNGYFKQFLGWSRCCPANPEGGGDHIYSIKKLEAADPAPCNCLTFEKGGRKLEIDSSSRWWTYLRNYVPLRRGVMNFSDPPLAIRRVNIQPHQVGSSCFDLSYPTSDILDMAPESRTNADFVDSFLMAGNAYIDQIENDFMIAARGENPEDPDSVLLYVGPVDVIPPTVRLVLPWDGYSYSTMADGNAIVPMTAEASDSFMMGWVEFYYKPTGTPDSAAEIAGWTSGNNGGLFSAGKYLTEGSYQVWAVAYDAARNTATSSRVSISVAPPD